MYGSILCMNGKSKKINKNDPTSPALIKLIKFTLYLYMLTRIDKQSRVAIHSFPQEAKILEGKILIEGI